MMIKWQKKHGGGISWTRKKFKHRLQLLVKARMVAQVNFMATQQALECAWPCCSGCKGSAKGKQAEQQKKCNTCGGVTQGLVQTADVHDACGACCCRYEDKDELFMKCHTLSQMLPGFACRGHDKTQRLMQALSTENGHGTEMRCLNVPKT